MMRLGRLRCIEILSKTGLRVFDEINGYLISITQLYAVKNKYVYNYTNPSD